MLTGLFCSSCGAKAAPVRVFCPACGNSIDTTNGMPRFCPACGNALN
ncbi:MAG: zinc-ribbon domain-containing protein [Clostridiales bacterium]|nr:zinc-ribbon domain-containing protein [Clostridiales bacterium]